MNYLSIVEEKLNLSRFSNVPLVQTLAAKSKQRPEHITLAIAALTVVIFLLTGFGHKILLILAGFLYPAYKSFAALESEEKGDEKRWLTYWIVFGFVFAFKNLLGCVLCFIPFVNLFLTAGLIAVYSPLTNGYLYVYEYAFKPFLKAHQTSIRKYIDMASDEIADKVNRGGKLAKEQLSK